MINITIQNNNSLERKYILDIIFNEFLGLNYCIKESENSENWEIELENGGKVYFEDHFFNKYSNDLEYLQEKSIPSAINYQSKTINHFIPENDIPIVYGTNTLIDTNLSQTTIKCSIDIFASSFFMLTRWEEYVNKNRDSHDRFPAMESLAFKNNFLDRPIVNEYVVMLKNMLLHLDNNLKFKEHKYQLYLTHDVDFPLKYPTISSGIKEIIGDIIKRKNVTLALSNSFLKIKTTLQLQKDPFNTFDYLMDVSEKLGVKSYFFFMAKGQTQYDNMNKCDNNFVQTLVKRIKQKGHKIGIHPTYNAYNDFEQFKKEKKELEKKFDTSITFGRQHYLRFEVPKTWQIWEDNGMDWDSTCSYSEKEGFRCGVCYEYSIFNILTRQKLTLKEKPLIVMEGSFTTYQPDIKAVEMENKIKYLIGKVKKYEGEFVFSLA
jgi:hypothetical protein